MASNQITKAPIPLKYYPNLPIFFNETAILRTYFRNADDVYNSNEWDGYDLEATTTVGNTITLTANNYIGGYQIAVDSVLTGARWKLYQYNATSGNAHFQLWTGTSSSATLRTTDLYTANRQLVGGDTDDISISLSAGDYITAGIQYVSGTSTIWYGSVTLKLQEA